MKTGLKIPKESACCICQKPATHYCPYCVEEYDTAPAYVPSTFYCDEHYEKTVQTGNCCYENEKAYADYKSVVYDW